MTLPPEDHDSLDSSSAGSSATAAADGPDQTSFADLGLHSKLVDRLAEGGYLAPTPIQEQAIPPLLAGRDVVGQAQTGTGKTAAFALPMIQRLDIGVRKVQGLILCPTRELALQVTAALASYGESRRVRVLTVYGGAPIHKQLSRLNSGVHVVVGTPGRVKDCIARGALSLNSIRQVVLDEADEMLRMGFLEEVEEILGQIPQQHQTALFSATMPREIQRVAAAYLDGPLQVRVAKSTRTVERIDQRVIVATPGDKLTVLTRILEAEPTEAVLIFARTRAGCARLVESLRDFGVAAAALHGELSQDQRENIVSRLRAGKIQIVVATDVAARGLDVDRITHVINYDPPSEAEVYVHRIGRTGRAGREGVSILLLTPRERRIQSTIERYTGQSLRSMEVPSKEDVLAGRVARFRERIHATIEGGGLEPYRRVVDEMMGQPGADAGQIAAALAALASRERPLEVKDLEPKKNKSDRRRGKKREHPSDVVHIFVPLGLHAGVTPADLVGALANEAGVTGKDVGRVDIREKVSFVEVAVDQVASVVERMKKVTLRGRPTTFMVARPGSFEKGRKRPPAKHGFGKPKRKGATSGKYSGPRTEKPVHKFRKKR